MDKSNDEVSIDVQMLADSLRCKFETLYPLSEDCCIYPIPPKIRMLNQSLYTPKRVSIGPLHHNLEELKPMQEHKLRYLQHFLQQITAVSMEKFLQFIKSKEADLRNCYAETIKFGSEEFLEMILLDAVFVIQILLRYIPQFHMVDRIFTNPGMIKDIVFDITLLENQLPIVILQDLFMFAKPVLPEKFKGYSLSQFTSIFFSSYICPAVSIDGNSIESNFSKATHFVDLLRLCLRPPERVDTERQADSEATPNVTKLHQSGIKFKRASTSNLLDIRFSKGTLEIPKLTISNMTVHLLRNLQMFEALHCTDGNYMNDYGVIINRLLNTSTDVELLIQKGVIENRILDGQGVSTLFGELSRDARVNHDHFYYSGVVKDLQDYCNYPCHKWEANLKQNYFNTPWAFISVIAAVTILVLTSIQTICSVIGL